MAEQDTDTVPQYTTVVKAGETLSTNLSDEHKQKEPDSDQNTTEERSKDHDQPEEEMKPSSGGPTSLLLDSKPNVGKNCATQDDDRSHGDNSRETPRNKEPTVKPDEFSNVRAGETLSTSLSDEHKQKELDSDQNTTEERSKVTDSVPLSTSTNKDTERDNTQNMEQIENHDQPEEEMKPSSGGPTSLLLDSKPNLGKNCATQDDDRSHGDNSGETSRNKEPTVKPDEFSKDHSGETKAAETSPAQTPKDTTDDEVDRSNARLYYKPLDIKDINTGTGEDGRGVKVKYNTSSPLKPYPQKEEEERVKQRRDEAETLGPTTEEKATEPAAPEGTGILGGNAKYWIVCIVALSSILVHHLLHCESPPEKTDVRKVDIFLRELEMVKTRFPNQHPELWRRSKIHLARHLQTAQPTEPVSLILTAGRRAERTLHCLAQGLASAFSAALNASVLHIDGASKASQDSDQVKLDIDRQLRAAFEGDKPVAVIHRFEELPPGSTLIFYRYCDHENAAYKKTSLIFTVLLGGEEELHTQLGLSAVEEMVDDQLQNKFLSSGHRIAFDSMDLDKYSGLWSRISHLILPVAAEKEHGGC
ncbi:torsin-1A-interacting protein 2-like isoform X2 [Centroberyx affinis]|uniref:torsin-1A-interacting protein 2-like isoform X2 n=1 Tax=Centroberyx affinis TaxID=166261 RepID=UPI003A5C147D